MCVLGKSDVFLFNLSFLAGVEQLICRTPLLDAFEYQGYNNNNQCF